MKTFVIGDIHGDLKTLKKISSANFTRKIKLKRRLRVIPTRTKLKWIQTSQIV